MAINLVMLFNRYTSFISTFGRKDCSRVIFHVRVSIFSILANFPRETCEKFEGKKKKKKTLLAEKWHERNVRIKN